MILKKPYAFLIKHFKLIHLLLCIPFIYLIIRIGAIASFFSSYVQANYYTSETNLAGTYINYFMYGAILLIILLPGRFSANKSLLSPLLYNVFSSLFTS